MNVLDRRNRQRHFNPAAVLALAHGLVVLNALAAPDAFDNGVFFAMEFGWNQRLDRPAHDLFGEITENPLCALVPACDDAVEVFADNGGACDR
jgi:hypothetical protein